MVIRDMGNIIKRTWITRYMGNSMRTRLTSDGAIA